MRWTHILLLCIILVTGCDDDDVAPPGDGMLVVIPADAPTLQAAIDRVAVGGVIQVDSPSLMMSETVVVGAEKMGITIRGVEGAARPVLELALTEIGEHALVVRAPDVTIEHVEIRGTFDVGLSLEALGARVVDCRIDGGRSYSISIVGAAAGARIERNLLVGPAIFGVHCTEGAAVVVQRNTIVGAGDCGIYSALASPVCEGNIVVDSANFGIACFGSPLPTLDCNVLFANETADYSSLCVPGADDQQADPLFCDTTSYALSPESPCAPAQAGACGVIGATETVCEP